MLSRYFRLFLHLPVEEHSPKYFKRLIMLGPVQTPIFSWAELNWNKGRPKSRKSRLLIQTPNLIHLMQKKSKCQCLSGKVWIWRTGHLKYVIIIYALGSAHEKFRRLNQSRSKAEIPGWARREERLSRSKLKQPFSTDSDADLFMYLIQAIRFGSWKVRRLNWALVVDRHVKSLHCAYYLSKHDITEILGICHHNIRYLTKCSLSNSENEFLPWIMNK